MMDQFHVIAVVGTKLDLCRERIQRRTCGTVTARAIRAAASAVPCVPGYRCSAAVNKPG
jgi:hypothetical protein